MAASYLIRLDAGSLDTLPVVLAAYSDALAVSKFDKYSLPENSNIDMDSIALNKRTQMVFYTTAVNQSMFAVAVHRASLEKISYPLNLDRPIQNYDGSNSAELSSCDMSISYKISVFKTTGSVGGPAMVSNLPVDQSACVYGNFDTSSSSCQCNKSYGMNLCDTYLSEISALDSAFRKLI